MFEWLLGESDAGNRGLQRMRTEFGQMLDAGRQVFCTAANALVGGTEPEVIREEVFATDKLINRSERQIRRELVIHASVHGTADISPCLMLMSIVKDAERVGDNAKNLFDLAVMAPRVPAGENRDTLVQLKDRIGNLMVDCRKAFDARETEDAKRLIVDAREIEDVCDARIEAIVQAAQGDVMAPVYVLAYRYMKRIVAHMRNVASSVVQPLHKLDFTSKITADDEQSGGG